MNEEKFKQLYPDFNKTMDEIDEEKDSAKRGLLMSKTACHIIKIFNPAADIDSLLLDTYAIRRIMDIWSGSYNEDDESKKKESTSTASDTTGQQ